MVAVLTSGYRLPSPACDADRNSDVSLSSIDEYAYNIPRPHTTLVYTLKLRKHRVS